MACALLIIVPLAFIARFRAAGSCEEYLNAAQILQRSYGIIPGTCFQHYLNKGLIPSLIFALPFVFISGVLFFKEKRKGDKVINLRQEATAFWLSTLTVLTFLLSLILIKSIHCDDFGCLALAPLIAASIYVFLPLIFGSSLWFLKVRYQWERRKFLAVTVGLIFFLLCAKFFH